MIHLSAVDVGQAITVGNDDRFVGHRFIIERDKTLIPNRNAMHVRRQILERRNATANRFNVDHKVLNPGSWSDMLQMAIGSR